MAQLFMRYPGGVAKALTFSYDDGVEQDIKFIEILDKNGLRGTFNLNSGRFAPEGKVYAPGTIHRPMTEKMVKELYSKGAHEVAVHALTHPHLEHMSAERISYEIVKDRENLEALFGKIIRGMAYPYGTHNDTVVEVLKACGNEVSRENIMKQVANMRGVEAPLLLPGIKMNTSPTDFYPIQSVQMQRFKGETWELFGGILSNESS
jgi:peptidoglycan/xylan/chitin deacetylase (PgdA/CDA1 family)